MRRNIITAPVVQASAFAFAAAVVLVVTVAGAACSTPGGQPKSFVAVDPRTLPPPGNEAARVILDELIVRLESAPEGPALAGDTPGPVAVRTHRRQVQIFKEAGQVHTVVNDGYSTSFEKVEHFSARVLDDKGNTLGTWNKSDASDEPAFESFVLYADSRALYIDSPDQPPGNIVESVVSVRTKQAELFAMGQGFGEDIPVLKSRLVVDVPTGMTIEHVAHLGDKQIESKPLVESMEGFTRYTWERRNTPPFRGEPMSPGWGRLREEINARVASWTDAKSGAVVKGPDGPQGLSRYTYGLQKDRAQVTPAIEARVKEILKGVDDGDPRAKARRLYAWTRDNIRYCALEVGIGGWVPHSSVEVEKNRYGDCKDKANLLKSFLKSAGIESRLVTIFADAYPEPFRLPVLGANFNHAILVVDLPTGPAWVDPTTRTTPFDSLPSVDSDRLALPISERGDQLMPTLQSSPERERLLTSMKLAVAPSGTATGAFTLEAHGVFSDELRDYLLDRPEAKKSDAVAEFLPLDDLKITKFVVEGAVPPEERAPAFARGDVETQVTGALAPGKDALLSARTLWRSNVPVVRRERTAPVVLGFRSTRNAVVELALPAGTVVSKVPDPIVVDSPHFRYALTWTPIDGGVRVERDVVFKVRAVPSGELPMFADAADRVAAADEEKVVLRAQ